jgi:hypothetical protein
MVLAARMGPRAVAKMAVMERVKVMRSRFHIDQLSGSLGSSDGCGTCKESVAVALSVWSTFEAHQDDAAGVAFQARGAVDGILRTLGIVEVSGRT